MIVALAAGGLAQLALNPTQEAQTMTAYMVQIFLGDAPFNSVEYYSSYAVGATLFLMTLALTIAGGWILKRFREEYED
jgi:phosphate transport system permease protein